MIAHILVFLVACGGVPSVAQLDQALSSYAKSRGAPGIGCFFYEWRFGPFMRNVTNPRHSHSANDCHQQCQGTAGCEYFGFKRTSKECWLADSSMNQVQADSRFVSGPRQCADVSPMCTESPGHDFPGRTPAESNAAWATGLVPPNLQCWPRTGDLSLSPCVGEAIQVLDNTQEGWPGHCFGLQKATLPVATVDVVVPKCQAYCEVEATCAAWQAVSRDGGATAECWMGMGYDCDRPRHDADFQVVASQRFMRGTYRMLMDLKGYEVVGLRLAFPASRFTRPELAIAACNHTCLSNIECEVWTYSTSAGCRVSDPKQRKIPYPATTGSFSKSTPNSGTTIAGQYIQHVCTHPEAQGSQSAMTPAPIVITTTAPPTTYTTTSTPLPTTTSTLLPTTTSTTHAPGTPAPAKVDRFVKGEYERFVYFQDSETNTKHLVRAGCDMCMTTSIAVKAPCADYVTVSDWYIQNLPSGEDFECNMLKHKGALGNQEDMLHARLQEEITLAPLPPVTLSFTVKGLRFDAINGRAFDSFYRSVKQEIAREAQCPLNQVTVSAEPKDPGRNVEVKVSVEVSREPAVGQATFQHVQSRLSSRTGSLAQMMVNNLNLWATRNQVAREQSEGEIGIEHIYTSIAGMEMLSGYAPTATSTTATSSTRTTTTVTTAFDTVVVARDHHRLTVDDGQHRQSPSNIGWILLVFILLATLICTAVLVFDSKIRRRFKRQCRRGISILRQQSFTKSDDEDDAEYEEAHEGDEYRDWEHGVEYDSGKPLMDWKGSYMGRDCLPEATPTFNGQPMDLVTITPNGLQVTPLGSEGLPPGVPVMDPRLAGRGQGVQPPVPVLGTEAAQAGMDLVQVTTNGLNVTPLNGAPPPGVPFYDTMSMPTHSENTMGGIPTQSGRQVISSGSYMPAPGSYAPAPGSYVPAPGTSKLVDGGLSGSMVTQVGGPMGMSMASPIRTGSMTAPLGTQIGTQMAMAPAAEEYDLVTVTPRGLHVMSLDPRSQAPQGLPILDPSRQASMQMPSPIGTIPSMPSVQYHGTAALPTTVFD